MFEGGDVVVDEAHAARSASNRLAEQARNERMDMAATRQDGTICAG
jgi:hypothetical protein